jgi:hypothetical protein
LAKTALLSAVVTALAMLGAGCSAITSDGPAGPLRPGTATQISASWAYAYGPATATVDGMTVKGNGQMAGEGPHIPSPFPVTVGFRQAIGGNAEPSATSAWSW